MPPPWYPSLVHRAQVRLLPVGSCSREHRSALWSADATGLSITRLGCPRTGLFPFLCVGGGGEGKGAAFSGCSLSRVTDRPFIHHPLRKHASSVCHVASHRRVLNAE